MIPQRPDAPGVSSFSAPAPHYDGRPRSVSVVGFVLTLVATTLSLVVLIAVIASGWDGSPPSAGGPQPPDWVGGRSMALVSGHRDRGAHPRNDRLQAREQA
jgi:hypothetical protein